MFSLLAAGLGLAALALLGLPEALLGAPLFSLLDENAVRRHGTRARVLKLLERDGGLTAVQLATRTGTSYSVMLHHLQTLETHGFIRKATVGRTHHFFLREANGKLVHPRDHDRLRDAILRRRPFARFYELVMARPGISLPELSRLLGRSPSTVSRTGARLEELGLIRKHREGRLVRFEPADDADSSDASDVSDVVGAP